MLLSHGRRSYMPPHHGAGSSDRCYVWVGDCMGKGKVHLVRAALIAWKMVVLIPVQYASQSRLLAYPDAHRNAYPNAGPVRVPTDDGTRCVLGLTGIWRHAGPCWMTIIKERSRIAIILSGMPIILDLFSYTASKLFFIAYFLEAMANVGMRAGAWDMMFWAHKSATICSTAC